MSRTIKKHDPSLANLIKKFGRNDIVAEMEKEYMSSGGRQLPLSQINDNSTIKRAKLDEETIERFANGIKEKGLWNPLVVRPVGNHYELLLGRKRYHAAKKAGLETVPCVLNHPDDQEALLMLLADIRDQRDSNVVEMALVYAALRDKFGYDQATLANLSHCSRSQVTNILRLLHLPDDVLDDLSLGVLSYGHCRALVNLSEEETHKMVRIIKNKGLSVRQTEEMVRYGTDIYEEDNDLSRLCKKLGVLFIEEGESHLVFDFPSPKKKEAFLKFLKELEK